MALPTKEQWEAIFTTLNIPKTEAATYADSFTKNRMTDVTLNDSDPDDLRYLGVKPLKSK